MSALQFADAALQKDKELVLPAVAQPRSALENADAALLKDKELGLAGLAALASRGGLAVLAAGEPSPRRPWLAMPWLRRPWRTWSWRLWRLLSLLDSSWPTRVCRRVVHDTCGGRRIVHSMMKGVGGSHMIHSMKRCSADHT